MPPKAQAVQTPSAAALTRHAQNYLAMAKFLAVRLWVRHYESAAYAA
jgi:hypothetical protein